MRLAFIGGYGHHYLRGALTDKTCDIDQPIAVAGDGHDDARAETFARSLPNNPRWYADAREMIDQVRPHAISIGSVYGFNSDLVAMALEAGIPCVTDKPAAATWQQFHRLQELTKSDPTRVVCTEFDFRCRSDFNAAKRAVDEGLIGDVCLAVAQKSYRWGTRPDFYRDRRSYGGTLMWIASHGVDVIPFTTGRRFTTVAGVQGNVTHPEFGDHFEDHIIAMYKLDNGGSAVVHTDFSRPIKAATHGDDRLRLSGSKGVIEVRAERCLLTTHDQSETDITDRGVTRPIHVELLAALEGRSEKYGTASTLETAEILLKSRDAIDQRNFASLA
jgi:predicted dehydrogenase